MVYLLIRRLLWKTTHRILDRTVDQVVQAGERHLVSGVEPWPDFGPGGDAQERSASPGSRHLRLASARSARITVADVMAGLTPPQDWPSGPWMVWLREAFAGSPPKKREAASTSLKPSWPEGGSLLQTLRGFLRRHGNPTTLRSNCGAVLTKISWPERSPPR